MKGFTLKLRDNLWVYQNRIISYETEVGRIAGDTIVSYGKFSRTTTKQINHMASLGGYHIKPELKSKTFWKYEVGVRCNPPGTRLVSKELSERIVSAKLVGAEPTEVILGVDVNSIGRKDLSSIVDHILTYTDMTEKEIESLIEFSKLAHSGTI